MLGEGGGAEENQSSLIANGTSPETVLRATFKKKKKPSHHI